MGNLSQFFTKLQTQFRVVWAGQSLIRKVTALGILTLIAIGMSSVFFLKRSDQFEYLFVDLSQESTQSIMGELKRMNVSDYQVDSKGVKVPSGQVADLRMKLAQEGLPSNGIVGWEKFDTQDFTRTEFEQNIHKMRAIQGEIARTIMSIDGVTSARVHIVNPKQSLFVEDQKDVTAAVYIKSKRGITLSERQIKGIQNLVCRSVEGLKPNNVILIDQEGQMLTKVESEDYASKMTKEMQSYKHSVEKDLEAKIRGLVGRVVGPERVEAKVDVSVDFTQEEQTISDVDPEKVAVISKNTQGASMEGNGLNPTGIPGSKSNVPGEDSELVNYEVSKTIAKKTMPVGNLKRISAAVLVDGRQEFPLDGSKPVFDPRTAEEMKQIEEVVKKAIGFQTSRDEVTVTNMMFQMDPTQMQAINEVKKENREYISTLALSGAVAFALVLFFIFVVRPYFRWLSYDPERKAEQTLAEEYKLDLDIGNSNNIQVKEDVPFEKLSPKEQIMYLAKNEPKRTTEALRMMLSPNQTQT
ncbi:MAG: flagellar basal-body MS-ring/collar protein FliF [Proteobacteria bacterium]|nr:flagellar basal-body MS-ring/collar protein FliF [Pseudomonadota bacterium]